VEADWSKLMRHLLIDGNEHAALLFCGVNKQGGTVTYLVRQVVPLTGSDFLDRGRDHLAVAPMALARHAKRARSAGAAIVLVHSHPFAGSVAASDIDLRTESDLCRRVLTDRTGAPAAALVVGPDGVDARSWTSVGATPLHTIHVIGERVVTIGSSSRGVPNADRTERPVATLHVGGTTDRQELLWGQDGQKKLRQSHVVLVGCGGTGSHVALQLAHLRVGRLTLIDDDRVEPSNLSRILTANPADIGRLKAEVLANTCRSVNPDLKVASVPMSILDVDPAAYTGADLIICATDGHASRSLLTEVAVQYLLPMIDLGVEVVPGTDAFRAGGGVRVLRPGQGCLWCARTLSPALVREEYLSPAQRDSEVRHGYIRDVTEPAPSVVALNGVVSSLAVLEACQLLVGMLGSGRARLVYRAERRAVAAVALDRDANCHVCGDRGVFALGDAQPVTTRRPYHSVDKG
jgi:molybdopterin/thiamine biosynthesis adenylyltransferase/proteasome lid subunit RPN8/RPN11